MKRSLAQMLALAVAILGFVILFSLLMRTRPAGDGQGSAPGGTPSATGTPSDDPARLLYDRLVGFGVPVEEVSQVQGSPQELRVTLRTEWDETHPDPNLIWYEYLTEHEARLAPINLGFRISGLYVDLIDRNGIKHEAGWTNVDPDDFVTPYAPTAPAPVGDEETRSLLEQNLDFEGLEIQSLSVRSGYIVLPNTKLLEMELIYLQDPNDQINSFLNSLPYQLSNFNEQTSAQIAVTRVKIFSSDGRQLAEYIVESPMGSEYTWLSEGIERNWDSEPAVSEEIPGTTPTPAEYPAPEQ